MPGSINFKGLLTLPEVSKLLGLSYPTIRKLVDAKEILSVQLGDRRLVPKSHIDKILQKH